MEIRLVYILVLTLLYTQSVRCSERIIGCKTIKNVYEDDVRGLTRLSCSDMYNLECYESYFVKRYSSSDVQKIGITDCSGVRLDDRIPRTFKNIKIYLIPYHGLETITSEDLNFEHLEKFSARNNQLTNISGSIFVHTTKLMGINLAQNKINRIGGDDFKGADNLELMILSKNNISSIDKDAFSNLIKLTDLDLSYNSINNIEQGTFRNNKQLQILNLRENPLQRIDENIFVTFTKLIALGLSYENIKHFDSSHLKDQIKFKNNPQFVEMNYPNVTIPICSKDNFAHFTYFNISGNQLSNAAEVISWLSSIETLDVSSNPLYELNPETFKRFNNLKYLNLRNTDQTTFDFSAMNSRKLEVLQLEDNLIKRLDHNILVPMISGVKVQFSWNEIEEIDTSSIDHSMSIEDNGEGVIVLRVQEQNFEMNCTKERFNQLTYFNISGNKLENGPQIIGLLGSSIQTLDLSSNFVGKLDAKMFKKFNNLQYLNLRNTNLSNFGFATFYHQNKLKSLDISYNQLKKVDFSLMFRNFIDLEVLNLEANNLTEVNTITRIDFPKLLSLGISKNHFSCHYLAKFVRQRHGLHLLPNPSDQTNIDGVDCRYEE